MASPRAKPVLRRAAQPRPPRQSIRQLTPRETEILSWVAYGKSNAEIGAILGISSTTVGKHLEHIYPKLGVENRTAAASFLQGRGHDAR
jgi:DNA-binding CsgD family transcriptional regulator